MIRAIRADFLFSKGQKQANLGNWDSSVNFFDRALALNPDNNFIYLYKALSLSSQRKYHDAIGSMKKAIALKPENHAHYLFQGVIHYDHGEYEKALTNFKKSLSLSDESSLLKCYIAMTSLRLNERIDDGYDALLSDIQNTNPECKARFLVLCESFLLENKEISRSFGEREFYKLDSNHTKRSRNLLNLFFEKINLAYIDLLGIFNSVNKNYYKHYFYAKQKLQDGNIAGSIKEFKSALSYVYEYNEAFYELLRIYFYQNDYPSIIEALKKLEKYDEVSNLLFSKNDRESEKDKIAAELKNYLGMIIVMGRYYYHTGYYRKAIDIFKIVVSNSPDYYFYNYYLGLSYLGSGDPENAYIYFKKTFQKLNPKLAQSRLKEMIRVSESASTIH